MNGFNTVGFEALIIAPVLDEPQPLDLQELAKRLNEPFSRDELDRIRPSLLLSALIADADEDLHGDRAETQIGRLPDTIEGYTIMEHRILRPAEAARQIGSVVAAQWEMLAPGLASGTDKIVPRFGLTIESLGLGFTS